MSEVPKDGQQKEKTLANIERIEKLLNSVKDLKNVIDSCHNEITNLCNHIVSKLFDAKPVIRRVRRPLNFLVLLERNWRRRKQK
jgi:hypothetical protein